MRLYETVLAFEGAYGRFWNGVFYRPVLKHGPRSISHVQVIGWKNPIAQRNRVQVATGYGPPGVSDSRLAQEHIWYDPKDDELRLSTLKPGETLVEGGRATDVQIVLQTWV